MSRKMETIITETARNILVPMTIPHESSTLKMEIVGSCETLVPIDQNARCHIPEDCNPDMSNLYADVLCH
jgi:hypothetical protein